MEVDSTRIRCPRCNEMMDIYSRAAGGDSVLADMCLQCGGAWLDGAELAKVYPAFERLGERLAGSGTPESPAAHIRSCPRCGQEPQGFRFFEVHLDFCLSCQGLWVDGGELGDMSRTADRADGLPAPAPIGYRTNAAAAVRSGRVACKKCGDEIELRAAELTSEGPMCGPCAEAFRDALLDASLAGYQPPKNSLLPHVSLEGVGDVLGAVGTVLLAVLSAGSRCRTCGCSSHSRCAH